MKKAQYKPELFDFMIRQLRDIGRLPVKPVIDFGINSGKVLDLGCGSGVISLEWLLATKDSHLTAIDNDPRMLRLAEKNASEYVKQHGLDAARINFMEADATNLPFDSDSFDGLFSYNTLHEVPNPSKMLKEAWRALKPGGLYCIRDLHAGGDWTELEFAQKMDRLQDIKETVAACLATAFTEDEFKTIISESPMSSGNLLIKPMLLSISGKTA